ncbi:MAG: hypothetical protein PHO78_04125, partial [Methanomicrobium sp.]|nr:hypothetical protein [Methanomicrobium sp.]
MPVSMEPHLFRCGKRIDESGLPGADFNPHTREGCDVCPICGIKIGNPISIHTPVKGVTGSKFAIMFDISDFNPHTREGC